MNCRTRFGVEALVQNFLHTQWKNGELGWIIVWNRNVTMGSWEMGGDCPIIPILHVGNCMLRTCNVFEVHGIPHCCCLWYDLLCATQAKLSLTTEYLAPLLPSSHTTAFWWKLPLRFVRARKYFEERLVTVTAAYLELRAWHPKFFSLIGHDQLS